MMLIKSKPNGLLYGLGIVLLLFSFVYPLHAQTPEAEALEPVSLAEGEKLQVVATTGIVADVVKQVGGDLIDLKILLPVGVDPHTFEPAPRDIATVADAHAVFANGAGLEAFLDEMLQNAGGNTPVVHLSEDIEFREIGEHEHEHEEVIEDEIHDEAESEDTLTEEEHRHEDIDPHTWTSPANVIVWVENLNTALSSLDPDHASEFDSNAKAYIEKLEEIDAWIQEQIDSIPPENRKLVTDHQIFGYYADRYGLQQIGAVISASSTAAQPSAQEIVALQDIINEQGIKALFVGNTANTSLSNQVARDTGIDIVELYTGSLGPEGSEVETYLDYLRYNTNAIVEALK